MTKTIDVIILVDDTHNKIDKTLYSLAYQTKIEKANVYIVNNTTKIDYKKEIDFFSNFMKIEEIKIKKKLNTGSALQYALDKTTAKYIMFLQANGVLISPIVIEQMENSIKKSKANVVISMIKSENNKEQNNSEIISLYGKLYERSFIKNNGIKFCNSKMSEEVGFNMQIFLCDAKTDKIQDDTYLELKDYDTKTYNDYFDTIFSYMENMEYALKMILKNNVSKSQISYFAFHTIISAYYYYIEIENKEFRKKIVKATKEIYKIYQKHPTSKEQENQIWYNEFYMLSQNININERLNPSISLKEFLKLYKSV